MPSTNAKRNIGWQQRERERPQEEGQGEKFCLNHLTETSVGTCPSQSALRPRPSLSSCSSLAMLKHLISIRKLASKVFGFPLDGRRRQWNIITRNNRKQLTGSMLFDIPHTHTHIHTDTHASVKHLDPSTSPPARFCVASWECVNRKSITCAYRVAPTGGRQLHYA